MEELVTTRLLADLERLTDKDLRTWVDRLTEQHTAQNDTRRERERIERRLAELPSMRQRAEDALLPGG